ncbi:transposable element Tcb1 transposase [Trichonephila clavipes]|nr:transposable element Tcb1 transposase [Trichonephila clavipes]
MVLMDRASTLQILSQAMGSLGRQQVSARTVRRRLQQHGLLARRSWLWLSWTLHYRRSIFNGVINDKPRRTYGEISFFADKSRFCLQHQYGTIRVFRHLSEHILAACIRFRHTGLSSGVIVWGTTG